MHLAGAYSTVLCLFFSSVVYFSHRRSSRIKKLTGAPKNSGVDTFPNPVSHFGFSRQCGFACGKQVPLAPLGWYFLLTYLHHALFSFLLTCFACLHASFPLIKLLAYFLTYLLAYFFDCLLAYLHTSSHTYT